ncbi:MAG: HAD-IC family P-type ATPase [Acidimicrobiia bacterium]|nr:MAG: HAD-IC family P-type ATPase [Acidimicrobiia bacterium]
MSMPSPTVGSPPAGLTDTEVRERITAGKVNVVVDTPARTTRDIIRANVVTRFNILVGILLAVVLIAVREPRDALFGIVLIANAAIGIVQELRAKATLDRLTLLTAPSATVTRDGYPQEVPVEALVEGDVIALASGDQVPVDGPVLMGRGLEIDESLLTGESDSVLKQPGDMCLSGSFVVAGSGWFRAERVGKGAYAATLAREAKRFTLVRSELRKSIDWILAGVSWAVVPVIALLLWSQYQLGIGYKEALNSAVAGAIGMIPQGLVLLTSLAFAVGVIRLGRRNVLVQELPALEGLARVDTICFDKTGTLTRGVLAVKEIESLGDIDPEPALAALVAAEPDPNATLRAIGDRFGDVPGWTPNGAIPFSSARKWSAVSFPESGTWVLGAPEIVAPNDPTVAERSRAYAQSGCRVVLLAWTDYPLSGDRLPRRLQPSAIVALGDQVRPDAAETLRFFAVQGVRTKVVSGDHPDTVAAIARDVGVPNSGDVVDARQLPKDPAAFAEIVERTTVFGRVKPHQKQAIVHALQSRGHVVAMTGDGVNDVLALKDSDIGIAIGGGSAAARSVAQLVLIDGEFATLPGVVDEGRRVIANIELVANLFVTKTVYAIFLAIAVGLMAQPFPLLPRHLTLVGSITIGVPAFFLALAPNSQRARLGFTRRVLSFAIPTGLAAGLATWAAYQLAINDGVPLAEARTTAMLVLSAIGIFALGIVSRPLTTWKKILIGSMVALLVYALVSTPSQEFFELVLPPPIVLTAAIGVVAITGVVMIFVLQTVGWIRKVPIYLHDHPPTVDSAWRVSRERLLQAWNSEAVGSLIDRYRVWRLKNDSRPDVASSEQAPSPEFPGPEDLDTIE